MKYDYIRVEPLSPALGAELSQVNLADPLDAPVIAEIRQAFLEHLVIFFRDQLLTPEQFLRFARTLGMPSEYPFVAGMDGYPEITEVVKKEDERVNFGGIWHSDTTYLPCPPMGTLLYAREIPAVGGDTLFANMNLAYESLSVGMRRLLDGLSAINSAQKSSAAATSAWRKDPGIPATWSRSPSIPSYAPIPRPSARRFMLTPGTPCASADSAKPKARQFSIIFTGIKSARSSAAASAGGPTPSLSGTTAPPSIIHSTTTMVADAHCNASPWRAIGRAECLRPYPASYSPDNGAIWATDWNSCYGPCPIRDRCASLSIIKKPSAS
jgi:hypothetical protein